MNRLHFLIFIFLPFFVHSRDSIPPRGVPWNQVAPGSLISPELTNTIPCTQSSEKNYFFVVQFPKEIFRGHIEPGRRKYFIRDFKLVPEKRADTSWYEHEHCFVELQVKRATEVTLLSAYFSHNGLSGDISVNSLAGRHVSSCKISRFSAPPGLKIQALSFSCHFPQLKKTATIGDMNRALAGQGSVQVRGLN